MDEYSLFHHTISFWKIGFPNTLVFLFRYILCWSYPSSTIVYVVNLFIIVKLTLIHPTLIFWMFWDSCNFEDLYLLHSMSDFNKTAKFREGWMHLGVDLVLEITTNSWKSQQKDVTWSLEQMIDFARKLHAWLTDLQITNQGCRPCNSCSMICNCFLLCNVLICNVLIHVGHSMQCRCWGYVNSHNFSVLVSSATSIFCVGIVALMHQVLKSHSFGSLEHHFHGHGMII